MRATVRRKLGPGAVLVPRPTFPGEGEGISYREFLKEIKETRRRNAPKMRERWITPFCKERVPDDDGA